MSTPTKICDLSVVSVRSRPKHQAEIVTQVLFGECVKVLDRQGGWELIECLWDGYKGWVDDDQLKEIEELPSSEVYRSYDWFEPLLLEDRMVLVPKGARLYNFDGLRLQFMSQWASFSGRAVREGSLMHSGDQLIPLAMRYLNVPYLWGGRSPFGVDCSGFVQVVYSFFDISLPRDAKDQAQVGEIVHFLRLAQAGDLAFFASERHGRKITHVGILIDNESIIHASGRVRMDSINEDGIYRDYDQGYTHYLKIVRRLPQFASKG